MSLIKAMVLGAILTGVFALVVGSQGSSAGFLYIHPVEFHTHSWHHVTLYWSWPLFFFGTGLAWALIVMTD